MTSPWLTPTSRGGRSFPSENLSTIVLVLASFSSGQIARKDVQGLESHVLGAKIAPDKAESVSFIVQCE
jgi:hypothetical protein